MNAAGFGQRKKQNMNLTSARKDGEGGNRRKQKEKVGRRNGCIGKRGTGRSHKEKEMIVPAATNILRREEEEGLGGGVRPPYCPPFDTY